MMRSYSPVLSSIATMALLFTSSAFADSNPGASTNSSPNKPSSIAIQDKQIQAYIENHPEVIYAALMKYQQQQNQKQKDSVNTFMQQNSKQLFEDSKDGILGNPNGSTTILVFSDYNCGYCRKAATILEKLIKSSPDLRVVVKQLPILGPDSNNASRIAMLAQQKHIFKQVNQSLFSMEKPISKEKLQAAMSKFGIDKVEIEKALSSKDFENDIKQNYQLATKLMIQGTPALLISNKDHTKIQFIDNYLDESNVKKIIDSLK
ncbi:MAG: DsbA family protein [Pseudomonadota bacterium]|nr:DsbA family protein [Pseudomonadota bacterium]